MVARSFRRHAAIALGLCLVLGACGRKPSEERALDTLDNQLIAAGDGNATDPAIAGTLKSQIMVDPGLSQQANADAVRPPRQPYNGALPPESLAGGAPTTTGPLKPTPAPKTGDCPQCKAARDSLTLGALASRQPDRRTSGCAGALRYSASWATRLPTDLPLYPDARVREAAGTADGACAMRAVSFSSGASLQQVMDWYYTRATQAGYDAEQQADGAEHVLGGVRKRDGGAFAVFLTTRQDGGTDIDFLTNTGN